MKEENKSAAKVEKEGAKVTGGPDAENKEANSTTPAEGGEEYVPEEGDKRKKTTGYNELPEQGKVGGDK